MSTISSAALREWARNDVITLRRLRALGLSRAEIRTLIRREHLHPAHEGVFFLSANPSRRAVWTAATARCPDGVLSHTSASALWGLVETDHGWPHLTVPRGRRMKQQGIRLHWTTRPLDRARIHGIPVTTLDRTLDDVARTLDERAIVRALRQAEFHHALDLAALAAEATSGRLQRVLARYVAGQGRTQNELEADFFVLVATRTPLPPPEVQRSTDGGRVDFLWPELGLIAEVDGYAAHRGRIAFREDRARDRRNLRAGLLTVRFTWEDVQLTPAGVAGDLVSAASSRSTASSTRS